jgi:hypothetical protein
MSFLVDAIVVVLLLQVVAIFAFQLSNGRVQLTHGVRVKDCTAVTSLPAGMAVPSFTPNYMTSCRSTIFGWPFARTVEVGRKAQDAALLTEISVTVAVDEDGRVIDAFFLDWLVLPLLLVFRWWLDRGDASPGRHATNIHIETASGERPARNLAKRYALFGLIWLPMTLFEAWSGIFGGIANWERDLEVQGSLSTLTLIALIATVVIPIVRRRDTFYDRWAGTAVVRDKPSEAVMRG